jgi:hypothetical protein
MRTKSSNGAKRANSSALGRLASSTLSKRHWISARYCSSRQVVAADADDAPALGQGAMAKRLKQAGISLRQARSPVPPNKTRSKLILKIRSTVTVLSQFLSLRRSRRPGDALEFVLQCFLGAFMKKLLVVSALAAAGGLVQAQTVNVICSVQAEWCNMIGTVYARPPAPRSIFH